ncbi:probable serine hydrolase [Diabrotica undecimpunctata]|uniref:probable serine hydrolase n=1 Tax=Diabrotica undecimpunctata TaxID=50387 RepID=UPI003B638234
MFSSRSAAWLFKIYKFGYIHRYSSSTKREFKEIKIKVPWGYIAGKWWEPYDLRPVVTIHGWQDNCQSFDRLIPLLNRNVGFLAIDLPGHGYSSKHPEGMLYHMANYLLVIKSLSKTFEWPNTSLMGHSLGAVTSYIYSMLYPSEVDYLICLDAVKPMVSKKQHQHYAAALEKFFKYNNFLTSGEPPSYTIEEIKKLVSTAHKHSILPENAKYIYERNIAPSEVNPGKFYFTRDPRLKTGSFSTYCQRDLVELAQLITMPIFIAKAKDSVYYEDKENFYEVIDVVKRSSSDFDFHYVSGSHHVHLNHPENVSDLINNFLRKNNVKDRSKGGITEDIIVNNEKRIEST